MAETITLYALCEGCGEYIYKDKNQVWYHSNNSVFCYGYSDAMGSPQKNTISEKKPPVLGKEFAVKLCCIHCGLPIHKWDNGAWYHLRMGQIECSLKNQKGPKATPPKKD